MTYRFSVAVESLPTDAIFARAESFAWVNPDSPAVL